METACYGLMRLLVQKSNDDEEEECFNWLVVRAHVTTLYFAKFCAGSTPKELCQVPLHYLTMVRTKPLGFAVNCDTNMASSLSVKSSDHKYSDLFTSGDLIHFSDIKISVSCRARYSQAAIKIKSILLRTLKRTTTTKY